MYITYLYLVLNAVPFLGSARPWASLEFEALQYYIEIHRYTRIGVPGPGVLDPYIYNLFIHGMLYVVYIYYCINARPLKAQGPGQVLRLLCPRDSTVCVTFRF
uniref:Very-long-chain 3-oxoacyl-CoA synthase n=1 Tax=Sipha flava TaxID=143950 RepID=A0A2S2QA85_9HEMI